MANSEDVNALLVYVFLNTKKKIQYTRRQNLMIGLRYIECPDCGERILVFSYD